MAVLDALKPDRAADQARAALEDGVPVVLLTGRAGTGKSWFVRDLLKRRRSRTAVLAPTGLAALNLEGQTIHSFFGLPARTLARHRSPPGPEVSEKLRHVDRIVIDEVSMVRSDVLDCIDRQLREARGVRRPFGGVQLLLVGDFYQLPPVLLEHESGVLKDCGYESEYAFHAKVLQQVEAQAFELSVVHRQRDPEFVEVLGRIRDGTGVEGAVAAINAKCCAPSRPDSFLLTATNKDADAWNDDALDRLGGRAHVFEGRVSGARAGSATPKSLPAPMELRVKVMARVVLRRNDEAGRWVNGSRGTVLGWDATSIQVRLDDGNIVRVEREKWSSREEYIDKETGETHTRELFSFEQFPLSLGWAVTIHKSQGMTLSDVQVDLGRGAFATGQAYVALSRAKSMEGLRLSRELRVDDVKVDPRIQEGLRRFSLS